MPRPPGMDTSAKPGPKPAGTTNAYPLKMKGAKRKGVKRAMRRGMISETAAKKHLGGSY